MAHAEAGSRIRITIVSDNNGPVPDGEHPVPRLGTAWGFACVVETADDRILFDTGSDGGMLIANMHAIGIDPSGMDALVISHEHWDHVGGIDALLDAGPVVITGCAHPGIVRIVRSAASGDRPALVMGGFHLKDATEHEIAATVEELRALGVVRVAPTHCTGDAARTRFALEFGDDHIPVGVGTVIEVGG